MAASVLESVVRPWKPEPVSALDWKGLQEEMRFAEAILATAIGKREKGVNILLYGASAASRTAFAHALLARLACDVYEVPSCATNGQVLGGPDRLRGWALAQHRVDAERPVVFIMEEMPILDRGLAAAFLGEDDDGGVAPKSAQNQETG